MSGELSAKETEILELFAQGLTAREVGKELHSAEATVKTHRSKIFAKLGANNTVHAVYLAMQRGLIK